MGYNALDLYKYTHNHGWSESYTVGEESKPYFMKLISILDRLKPHGDDNLRYIWVSIKRPTFRQFFESEYDTNETPFKEVPQEKLESARQWYESTYPTPKVWYELGTKHFKRKDGDEFFALFIGGSYAFSIGDINSRFEYDDIEFFEWLIQESESFVSAVSRGVCKEEIIDKIPKTYREGRVKRSDIWEAMPERKRFFDEDYNKQDVEKFTRIFGGESDDNEMIPKMTPRIFYEACDVIYKSVGKDYSERPFRFKDTDEEKERYAGSQLTPKEAYYRFADGRDDGLRNVPIDDPDAYLAWTNYEQPYFEFNGSHPWEIIPSISISFSMHLYPQMNKNSGWYFELAGSSHVRSSDTIKAAIALYDAGYPVRVSNVDQILDMLVGNDMIDVESINSGLSFYNPSIELPPGKIGKQLAEKVIWDEREYAICEGNY